ncbi:Target of rapamycin complex 2 subunit AVO2 [Candida viswanathii]|uniref:Target of rapamycin complex 2 subunit AVO2 n=1 Tax=Candida viswanathii TaxID=5486 RepID=A0A367YP24_9ASCO|nr:Target of rapamycin complex 2 subunit AVO2 [Candida viswanathii]
MLEPLQRMRNAIIEGNLPIVKRILARFPDLWLNIDPQHQGWSNLHYASFYGHYLICFHLISYLNKALGNNLQEQFTKLDLLAFDDTTVLHLCMPKNHSQTLHYLLQEFPGKLWLNSLAGELRQTPLHYSCQYNFKEGTTLLLEFGAQWMIQDKNGDTCLHLCFQYGSTGCLYELIKYIVVLSETKEEAEAKIQQLEKIKNKHDWVASEYSTSFDLITQYEEMKKDLLSQSHEAMLSEFKSSIPIFAPPSEPTTLSTSNGSNKVLASPIILMSLQTQDDKKSQGRQHSQSLPPEYKTRPPPILRNRSSTTYIYKPPSAPLNGPQLAATPRTSTATATTPTTPQTLHSSLKGVTISPSIRNGTNTPYNSNTDEEPASPQSIVSTTSSFNMSPSYKVGQRKKSFSFSKSGQLPPINSENVLWPMVSEESQQQTPVVRGQDQRPRKSSSASSIAARVAFNSSRSSLNQAESPRKKQPDSRPSNGHSNSLNSSSSLGSLTSSGSSGGDPAAINTTINPDIGPLRKTKSSGTLQSVNGYPNNRSTGINSSMTSLNSNGSDNLKKFSVHSISFSRVR